MTISSNWTCSPFTMKTSGFSVITASTPVEAISLINELCLREIDVAAGMNGCVLAVYLKGRCPELKIVSCSGALDRSQDEKMRVDGFISQSDGIGALLSKITEFGQSIRQVPLFSRSRTIPLFEAVNQRAAREPSQEFAIMSSGQHLGNHD